VQFHNAPSCLLLATCLVVLPAVTARFIRFLCRSEYLDQIKNSHSTLNRSLQATIYRNLPRCSVLAYCPNEGTVRHPREEQRTTDTQFHDRDDYCPCPAIQQLCSCNNPHKTREKFDQNSSTENCEPYSIAMCFLIL
jgi:hypothetical protein